MIRTSHKHFIKLGGITLMIIPHSQKHVFRLRINSHWVLFVFIFLTALCGLSAVSLFWYKNILVEKKAKEQEMNVWDTHRWIVDNEESKISKKIQYFVTYGNNLYYQIWNKAYEEEFLEADLAGLSSEKFLETMKPLENVLEFIIQREENYKNLPLGWPIGDGTITSEFGDRVSPFGFSTDFHSGTDFANAIGTPIYATADGIVTFAGNSNTGYGYYVKIVHQHGFVTLYGHASKILVSEKQTVKRGEVIALLGRSGSATGPHIHYEVRQENYDDANGSYEMFLNPMPFYKENR